MSVYHFTELEMYFIAIFFYTLGFVLPKLFNIVSKKPEQSFTASIVLFIASIFVPVVQILIGYDLLIVVHFLWGFGLFFILAGSWGVINQ